MFEPIMPKQYRCAASSLLLAFGPSLFKSENIISLSSYDMFLRSGSEQDDKQAIERGSLNKTDKILKTLRLLLIHSPIYTNVEKSNQCIFTTIYMDAYTVHVKKHRKI